MNLHEQLGALEVGVDQLIQAVVAPQASNIPETSAQAAPSQASALNHAAPARAQDTAGETAAAHDKAQSEAPQVPDTVQAQAVTPEEKPTLSIGRPSQNEITMTIAGKTVSLHPEQIGQLIEELSNARASMAPEPPMGVPRGWRFVSTKNPVMAVQKQSNGDRTLVLRHTGHGWVPFTFTPDIVIQMYAMLTQR
ncbi:hypothetical protein [Paraburkholderia sp. DHOC27]|uniref:hypothetical protein n=1 Tax=Paraburkholderia sp. DHOC27 TaxID=2303330 RepID=UPI000E3C1805|nr:hypothetical protein [Paraburkholderia sp. DHOC27]RFU48629.1 hypothetical protein D0B32_01975 [Paraburkholderia sp. DHOC27]